MGKQILEGIAKAIASEFGSAYAVYSEKVKQGVQKPCFFISAERTNEIPYPMGRYLRENVFIITFYPQAAYSEKDQCANAAERLFKCLEYIIAGGSLTRGSKMSGEIRDGVLKFTVHYDMFVYKPKEKAPTMERLNYNGKEGKRN